MVVGELVVDGLGDDDVLVVIVAELVMDGVIEVVTDGLLEIVWVTEVLGDFVFVAVRVWLRLGLGLAEADAEAELVAEKDFVAECVGEFDPVELGDKLVLLVIEGLIELVALILGDPDCDRVGQLVGVCVAVVVALAVTDVVPDAVRDGLAVRVGVTEADGVMDGLRSI